MNFVIREPKARVRARNLLPIRPCSFTMGKSGIMYDPHNWNTALHVAAKRGSARIAEELIASNFPIDLTNIHGRTPLHLAVKARKPSLARLLISAGASIAAADKDNETPLGLAVEAGDSILSDICLAARPSNLDYIKHLFFAFMNERDDIVSAFERNGYSFRARDAGTRGTLLHLCVMFPTTLGVLKSILKADVDVNARGKNDVTALHLNAQGNADPEFTRALIEAGADVEATDTTEIRGTPLFAACNGRHVRNVDLLHKAGADLNRKVGPGRSLLHIAAQDGDKDMLSYLVGHGVDPNDLDENGATAATWAAQNGLAGALKHLASLGTDISKADANGRTPLTSAVLSGSIETVNLVLTSGTDVNADNGSAISAALRKGNQELAEILVNSGAELTRSHLHDAAVLNNGKEIALFDFCIKHGAIKTLREEVSMHAVEEHSFGYIGHLLRSHQTEMAAAVVGSGFDVSGLSKRLKNFFCLACSRHGYNDVVSTLLSTGANKNTREARQDWTLVHLAAFTNNVELINILRRHRCDLNALDRDGRTPLHVAAMLGHENAFTQLLDTESIFIGDDDGNTPLHCSANSGSLKMVVSLLGHIGLINRQNSAIQTALHIASARNHKAIVTKLQHAGADIHKQDATGATALHYAAKHNALDALQTLLKSKKLDLNHRSVDGSTALYSAARKGALGAVEMLLQAGLAPNIQNHYGLSPICVAVLGDHVEAFQVMTAGWPVIKNHFPRLLSLAIRSGSPQMLASVHSLHEKLGNEHLISMRKYFPELLAEFMVGAESLAPTILCVIPYLPAEDPPHTKFAAQLLLLCLRWSDDAQKAVTLIKAAPRIVAWADDLGWQPLHFACRYGRSSIVKILFQCGADPEIKETDSHLTPYEIAQKYSENPDIPVLIEHFIQIRHACSQKAHVKAWKALQSKETHRKKLRPMRPHFHPLCLSLR